MKTASFFSYPTGPGRVSIARFAPRRFARGYRIYKPLSPGRWFNSVDYTFYRQLYFRQLGELDPQQIVGDLHELTDGAEPVLLCWENPPLHRHNWCHRSLVAEFLADKLGLVLEEIGHGCHYSPDPERVPHHTLSVAQ